MNLTYLRWRDLQKKCYHKRKFWNSAFESNKHGTKECLELGENRNQQSMYQINNTPNTIVHDFIDQLHSARGLRNLRFSMRTLLIKR